MESIDLSVKEFITEQQNFVQNQLSTLLAIRRASIPVITVCVEPGSGGRRIADAVAKRLNFTLFDKNILTSMANKASVKSRSLNTIEAQRPSVIQDFVTSIVAKDYVYTGDYLTYLKQQIEAISKIGRGVIVGRGANFILPPKDRFGIRVFAPLDIRVKNVALHFGVSLAEARKRVKYRENRRRAFVRESFHEDIADPENYDLLINTSRMDLDTAVETIIGAVIGSQAHKTFEKETTYIFNGQRQTK